MLALFLVSVFGLILWVIYTIGVAVTLIDSIFVVLGFVTFFLIVYKVCIGIGALWTTLYAAFLLIFRIAFVIGIILVLYYVYNALKNSKGQFQIFFDDMKMLFQKCKVCISNFTTNKN